jgi:hypothetical protein
MGSHIMNIGGNLKKFKLGKDGKVLGEYTEETSNISSDYNNEHEHDNNFNPQPDYQFVKEQILNSEGCRVTGAIVVNKVILLNIGSGQLPYLIPCLWPSYSKFSI